MLVCDLSLKMGGAVRTWTGIAPTVQIKNQQSLFINRQSIQI